MAPAESTIHRGDVTIALTDFGGDGPPVMLLHGLAGSSRELVPTAEALSDSFRVLLIDQRGHGASTRRPDDVSRQAFVGDVVDVIMTVVPGQKVSLVGQSMGAHTAFLVAATRPDLVERLVMLEGHVAGDTPEASKAIGAYFDSWPAPFTDAAEARSFLGNSPLASAWLADLEVTDLGLRPRFEPDVMQQTVAAVHVARWEEWESLDVPTLAIFAENGMFSAEQKDQLIEGRPQTRREDLRGASHDAHLDAFDNWARILRSHLLVG